MFKNIFKKHLKHFKVNCFFLVLILSWMFLVLVVDTCINVFDTGNVRFNVKLHSFCSEWLF